MLEVLRLLLTTVLAWARPRNDLVLDGRQQERAEGFL
jgi:hypothetical protein